MSTAITPPLAEMITARRPLIEILRALFPRDENDGKGWNVRPDSPVARSFADLGYELDPADKVVGYYKDEPCEEADEPRAPHKPSDYTPQPATRRRAVKVPGAAEGERFYPLRNKPGWAASTQGRLYCFDRNHRAAGRFVTIEVYRGRTRFRVYIGGKRVPLDHAYMLVDAGLARGWKK